MKKGYKRLLVLISSLMILLFINSFSITLAQELVLSDRIREAREAAKKEAIKEKVDNIKPVNIKGIENIYKETQDKNSYEQEN